MEAMRPRTANASSRGRASFFIAPESYNKNWGSGIGDQRSGPKRKRGPGCPIPDPQSPIPKLLLKNDRRARDGRRVRDRRAGAVLVDGAAAVAREGALAGRADGHGL